MLLLHALSSVRNAMTISQHVNNVYLDLFKMMMGGVYPISTKTTHVTLLVSIAMKEEQLARSVFLSIRTSMENAESLNVHSYASNVKTISRVVLNALKDSTLLRTSVNPIGFHSRSPLVQLGVKPVKEVNNALCVKRTTS